MEGAGIGIVAGAYRRANKSAGTKAAKKEHAVGTDHGQDKTPATVSSKVSRASSIKHSKTMENLRRATSSSRSSSTAAGGKTQSQTLPSLVPKNAQQQQPLLQTTATGAAAGGPVGKGAAVGTGTAALAAGSANNGTAAGAARSGQEPRFHHPPSSNSAHSHQQHQHHHHYQHHNHQQQQSIASRKRSVDHNHSATTYQETCVPSSSAPIPLHNPAPPPPLSPPRTPPVPAASSPRSRTAQLSAFSLSPLGAAATAAQRNRPVGVTSPTAAPVDRTRRPVRPAPDIPPPHTNKALPRLHDYDDANKESGKRASEAAVARPRPRASSAESATPLSSQQNPLRTKQLPQLPGSQLPLNNGSERKATVRRGTVDYVVPESGRTRLNTKPSGSHHQTPRNSAYPQVTVDGAPMPTPTNAHLMLAPLRSTTSGTMSSMVSGDALVPSASGSSVSVSTTSTATRNTRQVGPKPLVVRNNRTYINDGTLPYPLPVDLQELHRQSLRTLLLFQLLGGPITSPVFAKKPPLRVLEVGCGSGFWSMMCHRYFDQKGYKVSFTGMDVIPLCGSGLDPNSKPDNDMQWKFVQHDMRNTPWPFADGEFDLVMAKDICLIAGPADSPDVWDENIRVTAPGGVLELWETDHTIRMLRPHAPVAKGRPGSASEETGHDEEDEVGKLGVYTVTGNTPLSPPTNTFLSDYNGWITKALDKRGLSAVPNTQMTPWLLQEAESLTDISSIRLAVPLSEIRWEREGVGGVVTKGDGKSYIDSSKGKYRAGDAKGGAKTLTELQVALRRTALETVVGLIHSFEPILRETSGKSQDEWDNWVGKMMNDLMRDGGTSWGECLEVGAWSAKKRA